MGRIVAGISKFICPTHGPFTAFWNEKKTPVCPDCGGAVEIERASRKHPGMDYDKPVLSESMGVAPHQVEAHRKAHPDINMTDDGRVILKDHYERKRVMKKLGFFDRDGY